MLRRCAACVPIALAIGIKAPGEDLFCLGTGDADYGAERGTWGGGCRGDGFVEERVHGVSGDVSAHTGRGDVRTQN